MNSAVTGPKTRIATEGVKGRLRRHTTELARLATPIVISRSGFLFLIMADTIMTGHYSAAELAYLTIGMGMIMPLAIASLGMIMGTLVLTANAYGGGRLTECGPVWRRSISYAFLLGSLCVLVALNGEALLRLTGQTPDIAVRGGEIIRIIGLGMPGHLLFLSCAYFLEGINRPMPSMFVMVAANIVNISLNWLLIDGSVFDVPLGAVGAAWATTASRWFMGLSLIVIVWTLRDRDTYAIRAPLQGGFNSWRELRRIGYAIGLSIGIESIAFACLNVFAGWLGKLPLAAYGLTLNLMALVFMLAIGIGSATAVRVGIAHGRGDAPDAALAGWTGLGINTLLMIVVGVIVFTFTTPLTGIYTDDPVLLAEAAVTVGFIVWIFVPDGGQAVMANALRGRKDVWAPSIIQTSSFFGVMVPIGYVSTFVLENGVVGLFHGILAGCIVSQIWLSLRFHRLALKDIARMRDEELSGA